MKRFLGWAAAGLTALALATPAWADDDDYRRSRRGYGRGTFDFGYERGYHEGAKDGSGDVRSHRRFGFRHDSTYRDADDGYRSSYGPRREYERGFRRGYEEGYRRAYASRRYDDRRYDDRRIYESPRRW
jgi:hypothetical protein